MATRLDALLVNKNIATSREKAKELIKSGFVVINNNICKKPSQEFEDNIEVMLTGSPVYYVGRGGLKLEKAIQFFGILLNDMICADIGASTGGFTDCMLINGAKRVYAVDVGHDQLANKLRSDSRVINLEGINVRYISEKEIPEMLDFISVDVSFISITLILHKLFDFIKENSEMVCLIKPQFEAGKAGVGKKGVVKNKAVHIEVLDKIIKYVEQTGFIIKGLTYSPIKGPEGNIEYLIYLNKGSHEKTLFQFDIKNFVEETFKLLKNE